MERSCQAQLLAEAAGTPVLIDDEGARYTREFAASPYSGWISFQPLWDEICGAIPTCSSEDLPTVILNARLHTKTRTRPVVPLIIPTNLTQLGK